MNDQQETKRPSLVLLVVAVLLFVTTLTVTIVALGAGDADAPTVLPSSEPPTTQIPESPTPLPAPPVLASGEDEDFVFDVMDIETGVPNLNGGTFTTEAEGVFTLVKVRVSNIGDEPLGFFLDDIVGVDSWGRVLEGDGQAEMFVNDGLGEMVVPAGSVTKVVVFDVTDGTDLVSIVGTGSSSGSVADQDGVEIPLP